MWWMLGGGSHVVQALWCTSLVGACYVVQAMRRRLMVQVSVSKLCGASNEVQVMLCQLCDAIDVVQPTRSKLCRASYVMQATCSKPCVGSCVV
eukprot:6293616-Pyramimonas_sp.AAC.1